MEAKAQGEFPGRRVPPQDPSYPTMVRGFNPRWVASPAYVQVCGSTAQVVKTVQEAYDQGKRITVRCGGHCYEDFVCENDGGVLVDLSPMNGVFGKPAASLYCVEGGATLWNVYNELYREFGVTLPGGSCYSVGAGGHFTGGGYGLLSRLYGLTSDYLVGVEVVRVNKAGRAEAITVTLGDRNPEYEEIAWAHTGGGGGNFGIVTKFWFKNPPSPPPQVQLSSLAWNWNELTEVGFTSLIENFGSFFAANSEPKSRFAPLFSLLHLTQDVLPANGGRAQIALTSQFAGSDPKPLEEFEAALRDGELPSPTRQQSSIGHFGIANPSGGTRSLPWLYATQQLDTATPNQRGKYKSAYMNKPFPPEQIATMWKYLKEEPNTEAAQALLQIDSYGCEVNKVASAATAVAQRSSVMKLQYQTYWFDPSADTANLTWIRDFYEAMYGAEGPMPNGTTDGCFVNYPDVDLKNWQTLYYKDNYTRLREAKSLCDPHDVFRHQQSIEPWKPGNP